MKTEHQFAYELKKMMETVPLDEISVVALSKKCGVSRKTFYYHFRDVYDLLTLVFLDEKNCFDMDSINTNTELLRAIFNYYTKNNRFVDAAINSAGKDLFKEFLYNICFQIIFNNFIGRSEESKKLKLTEKKEITRFFSFGYSNTVTYYLSTHKEKTFKGLETCFAFLNDNTFEQCIKSLNKAKKHD